MNKIIEQLLEESTYYERGHGAFGESERYKTLDNELFAKNIIDKVFALIDDERFEIPVAVSKAVKEKFQDKE